MNLHAVVVLSVSLLISNNYYSRRDNSSYFICHAKKIDSYDLLIGDWDTSVRLTHRTKLLDIFTTQPTTTTTTKTTITKTGTTTNSIITTTTTKQEGVLYPKNGYRLHPLQQRYQQLRSQVIPCRLSLYANGTFGMVTNHHQNSNIQSPSSSSSSSSSLLIRGKWTLQTNPYCVTDRFYDDIVLESYPRVQKLQQQQLQQQQIILPKQNCSTHPHYYSYYYSTKDALCNKRFNNIRPIQRVKLKLQCRLSGHFSGRSHRCRSFHLGLPKYYARGKITHGTMTLEKLFNLQDTNWDDNTDTTITGKLSPLRFLINQYRRQRHSNQIIASFSARRYIPTYSDLISQSIDDEEDWDKL